MKLKEIVEMFDTTPRTIKYYEELGLIHPIRNESNYREYTDEDVTKLQEIFSYRAMGISLENIKSLLSETTIVKMNKYYIETLNSIDEDLMYLEQKRSVLGMYSLRCQKYLENPKSEYFFTLDTTYEEIPELDNGLTIIRQVDHHRQYLRYSREGKIHLHINGEAYFYHNTIDTISLSLNCLIIPFLENVQTIVKL